MTFSSIFKIKNSIMTKTKLMGILNVTPDSFFEGSRLPSSEQAINRAFIMETEGVDIIDVGGESTRPGAEPVSEGEELSRILPVLEGLKGMLSVPLSIDTFKPNVAKQAINNGVTLINDITGLSNPAMVKLAADENVEVCVMHMQGNPQTMQLSPSYEEDIISYLMRWFEMRCNDLAMNGIEKDKIIIDPGIGFGKSVEDNLMIIKNLTKFKQLGYRLLIGLSRKTFMRKIVNQPTEELLPATLAMNTIVLTAETDIIRVHDIKEHRMIIDLMNTYIKR